jgi:hypothetical protein
MLFTRASECPNDAQQWYCDDNPSDPWLSYMRGICGCSERHQANDSAEELPYSRLNDARLQTLRFHIDAVGLFLFRHRHNAIRAVGDDGIEFFQRLWRRQGTRPLLARGENLGLLLLLLLGYWLITA